MEDERLQQKKNIGHHPWHRWPPRCWQSLPTAWLCKALPALRKCIRTQEFICPDLYPQTEPSFMLILFTKPTACKVPAVLGLIWFSLFGGGCCCYLIADEALIKKFLKHIKYDDQFASSDACKVESKPHTAIREAFKKQEQIRLLFLNITTQGKRTKFLDKKTARTPLLKACIWVAQLGGIFPCLYRNSSEAKYSRAWSSGTNNTECVYLKFRLGAPKQGSN